MLHHFVVHPKSVNQSNAPVLPIMLATKLLPEQEAQQTALLEQRKNISSSIEEYTAKIAEINALIDSITLSGGILDPKGTLRTKLIAEGKTQDSREVAQGHSEEFIKDKKMILAAIGYGKHLS